MGRLRVVVDEGVPRQLVRMLCEAGLDAQRFQKGWRGISNGALIAAVEADGFAVLLTNDKNIAHQQSLSGRNVAVVALPLNRRAAVVPRVADILDTIRRAEAGQHVVIGLDGTRTARRVVAGAVFEENWPSVPSFKG